MKKEVRSILFSVITGMLMGIPVFADPGNDFNDLNYNVEFSDLMATFHMGIAIGEWQGGVKVDLPMEEDVISEYIRELIDRICNPENEEYNPVACEILREIFTEEVIEALNEQWNIYIANVYEDLPGAAHTRQLEWPLNGLGSIVLEDNNWQWPCLWNPQTGEYVLPPIIWPHAFATGPDGFWILLSGSMASGQIHREQAYDMDGEFIFLTEFIMGFRGALLMVGFGYGGPYSGVLM